MSNHNNTNPNVLDAAQACLAGGVSVIPINHATKRPAIRSWTPYQQQIADSKLVSRWFSPGVKAFAVIGGKVSGGLLILDFDVPRFYDAWRLAVGELADGLPVQQTGGGGYQVFLRCSAPGGNDKLAWAPNEVEETGREIAIETRGEGGYAVVAPSLHPSGNQYRMIDGDLANIPTIPQERVDAMLAAARKLDEAPYTRQERERLEKQAGEVQRKRTAARNGQAGIIGEFNAAHPIESLLEKHGYRKGASGRYIRPGGRNESVMVKDGRSFHWSTNDPLNDGKLKSGCGCHDAFDLFAHFEHAGDVQAAVKAAATLLGKEYKITPGDGTYYVSDASGLVYVKPSKDGAGQSSTWLTNFTAQIVNNVVEDDGAERKRTFEVQADLAGVPYQFTIPADQFASMNWAMEKMGAKAVVCPGIGAKDRARHAIQVLSNPASRTVYTHTGWRNVGGIGGNGGWAYLHMGGAIGQGGTVAGVEVRLPEPLSGYLLLDPPASDELLKCIQSSLKLLDLGPDDITVPLFCAVYRAPLGASDSAAYLAGPTGVFKSELAALGQQHFGAALERKNLPAAWSATDNALEGLAFHAKDTLLTIDDFAPHGGAHDVQKFHQKADRVLRAQGNCSGRARMRADGSLRQVKPPRGLILCTGEDVPKGQSIRARMMVVEVADGDISGDKLSARQADARAGLYAAAMAGYVRFLASRIEAIQRNMTAELAELRGKAVTSSMHRRTPDIVASLAFGLRYFIAFATDSKALTDAQAARLWDRGWRALGRVAEKQTVHQAAMEPTRRFLELLQAAIASGKAYFAAPDAGPPDCESGTTTHKSGVLWGWRNLEPQGEKIGWVDPHYVYLIPEAAFQVAQRMGGTDALSITSHTLWKRLHEKGVLIREPGRDELKVRKTMEGAQQRVVQLRRDCLMLNEPAKPANPNEHPAPDAGNGD